MAIAEETEVTNATNPSQHMAIASRAVRLSQRAHRRVGAEDTAETRNIAAEAGAGGDFPGPGGA